MTEFEYISIRGAREHNLQNIDLDIPREKLIVITGLSGSGKSSLAFDTIYAEGQRRYVESLSVYARQFLGMMERPDVDKIDGLSPAISIEQKTVSRNPRSTVGTVTEIYDYMRLLFARTGVQHCHKDGSVVQKQSIDQMTDSMMNMPQGTRVVILAPVVRGRKGHYREQFEQITKDGFTRVRIDGEVMEIQPGMKADRYKIHNIEIVVDRLVIHKDARMRLTDSLQIALKYGNGVVIINAAEDGAQAHDILYSQKNACPICGTSYEEPAPNSFSFNSPYGACASCDGLGIKKEFDLSLIVPDDTLSFNKEGLTPLAKPRSTWWWAQIEAVAKKYGFTFDTPIKKISEEAMRVILHGSGKEKYEIIYTHQGRKPSTYHQRIAGVLPSLKHYYETTTSASIREWAESFMNHTHCTECRGGRLKKENLAVTFSGKSIHDVVQLSVTEAIAFFQSAALTGRQKTIAAPILKEIISRLSFLENVGLDYLTIDRSARSLSGGEAQRIRLATQIGTQLVGVLYVLDEPSIGLHQRDNLKLIQSLKDLRDLGNTVIVVEHDKEMMQHADHVIDLGPGAGEYGGRVMAEGEPSTLFLNGKSPGNGKKNANGKKKNGQNTSTAPTAEADPITKSSAFAHNGSLTIDYLKGLKKIDTPLTRRKGNGKKIRLLGTRGHNLQNVTLTLPLGRFICVAGVSGSGKSSLINQTLYPILARKFYKSKVVPLPFEKIEGLQHIDKVIDIDQTPIGRTPRSNPATYTGLFTTIRDLYTNLSEAKIRGYAAGRFSFNVAGGRCDACEGDGVKKIEMNFLPDVYVICDVCRGKRYNRETLEVHYKGKSIADVLDMSVADAKEFFADIPRIARKLEALYDVGLGYIRLGQQATTLSGGEAQRVKLSTELSKIGTGNTLYILDEPTTGLHFEDVRMLLQVLEKLVEKGNTVVVIEHNLDVIKVADWVIDLGPSGGKNGGRIIAEGTPEAIVEIGESITGKYLAKELAG